MIPGNAPAEVGDQRRLHLWRDQDLNADTNALADAVAESDVDLFNLDGRLFWLTEGTLVPVSKNLLLDIITKHVATVRLVNRGSAEKPIWEREFCSFNFAPGADTSRAPEPGSYYSADWQGAGEELQRWGPGAGCGDLARAKSVGAIRPTPSWFFWPGYVAP
jgi:hypothetical protein